MKASKFILILSLSFTLIYCGNKKEENGTVKNVIILIPDGASTGLVTLSRWYNGNNPLAIDPHICGMIRTHCSDGGFPDSAPTSTAYATGVKTKTPYIGIDSLCNPRVSVLELARQKGLSTGVVVTCEFPHATPADFVCHYKNREDDGEQYETLAKQFVYNSPDLVFAGGERYLGEHGYDALLKPNKIKLITDKHVFNRTNTFPDSCLWALFPGNGRYPTDFMAYECDRDTAKAPGLSQMTRKAIELLSKNKKGFFLMVEGSQIDWAAHNNDPYAAVTDFIEFNKAVEAALEFAKKDKNTVIIVCPDHETGGISIGNERSTSVYKNMIIQDAIIKPLKKIEESGGSGRKLAELILENSANMSKDLLKKYFEAYNVDVDNLKENTLESLNRNINEEEGFTSEGAYKDGIKTLQNAIGKAFSKQNYIGWTTGGHTANDVFLAMYTPEHIKKITGVVNNDSIGRYIAKVLDLGDLNKATNEFFKKHTEFFNQNEITSLDYNALIAKKNGKEFIFEANSNVMKVNGEVKKLPSLVVRIDEVYYLPELIKGYY